MTHSRISGNKYISIRRMPDSTYQGNGCAIRHTPFVYHRRKWGQTLSGRVYIMDVKMKGLTPLCK